MDQCTNTLFDYQILVEMEYIDYDLYHEYIKNCKSIKLKWNENDYKV